MWRLCFRFADGNADDAEIVDYHSTTSYANATPSPRTPRTPRYGSHATSGPTPSSDGLANRLWPEGRRQGCGCRDRSGNLPADCV